MSQSEERPQLPPAPDGETPAGAEPRKDAPKPPPFRRLKGETAKAWEGFCVYVGLGVNRSLRRVAEMLNKSETVVAVWSSEYGWVERAAAVDEAIARARHEERVKVERREERKRTLRLQKLNRGNYDLGRRLRHRVLEMLAWPLHETEKEEISVTEDGQIINKTIIYRPSKWTFGDMLRAAELSDRMIRLGLGAEVPGGRAVTGSGDTHININIGGAGLPPEERLRRAVAHYKGGLLPERETYIDRLAAAEPGRAREELAAYVDGCLLQWAAEDFRVKPEELSAALQEDDPLLTAIDVTPGREE